jgi:hypothetical protein
MIFGANTPKDSAQKIADKAFGKPSSLIPAEASVNPYLSYFLTIPKNNQEIIIAQAEYFYIVALSGGLNSMSIGIDDNSPQNVILGATVIVKKGFKQLTLVNSTSVPLTVNIVLGLGQFFFKQFNLSPWTGNINAQGYYLANIGAFYFGNTATAGTWRILPVGNNLSVQRLESGVWNEKSAFMP